MCHGLRMGVWFRAPALDCGEIVAFQAPANMFKGRRSVGGQVTVTDKRFQFVPNRLDGLLGGRTVDIARSDITGVEQESPGVAAVKKRGLAALLRPQLTIESAGDRIVVVVRDLGRLRALLGYVPRR